ncbi:MAG TPA: NRDE family protein [Burkholderiales bacterium]|nr:NRDE family protein [Burkholderiales bacterium]
MCLILLAWRRDPAFPLVVAANRDEFHARPAARAGFWDDAPAVLAGRDLEARGTWMGVSRSGRFAAVTNFRGAREPRAVESRGALVAGFLLGDSSPEGFVTSLESRKNGYSGFNLLACDGGELWWLSNRDGAPRRLAPGVYGLANDLLDTPEVGEPKARFERALEPAPALETLFDVLRASHIVGPQYGTRCATLLLRGADGVARYAERAFDPGGREGTTLRFEIPPGAGR